MVTFTSMEGIHLEGYSICDQLNFKIINYYGPYNNQETFWLSVKDSGYLNGPCCILGGSKFNFFK